MQDCLYTILRWAIQERVESLILVDAADGQGVSSLLDPQYVSSK